MAVNSITYDFDELLSSTWMNYRSKLYDNIFNAIPFWFWLHKNGRKRVEDGGERIVINLEYGKNTTIASMTSGYDTIDTTPQDDLTSAYFQWREIAGSTSISNKQLAMNQGKHKIIDLLQSKANNTEMSMSEELEIMLLAFSAGNGGHDLLPLNKLIQADPTGSEEVGGINQNTYSWWRNQYTESAATTWALLVAEIEHMYHKCSKGGSKGKRSHPSLGLCDTYFYETYSGASRDKVRIVNQDVADLGFGGLKFQGMTFMWDEYYPDVETGTAITAATVDSPTYNYCGCHFINPEFLEFVVCRGQDFTIGPFIQPENQKAKTSIIYLMGELTCSNRRKQGVLFKVPINIAA